MDQYELDINTAIYNQFAGQYCVDRLSGSVLFNDYIEAPVVRELLKETGKLNRKNILDIGCGPGIYTKMLHKAGASIVALDSSEYMLNATKDFCVDVDGNLPANIEFIRSRFEDVDLEKRKFDVILATFMLSYFEDLKEAFKKMADHLGKNGKIITSMLHPVRMASTRQEGNKYLLSDYFSEGYYEADFLDKNKPLRLKRYSFEKIYLAAESAGLQINELFEPRAQIGCGFPDEEKVEFYSKNPSIVVMCLTGK